MGFASQLNRAQLLIDSGEREVFIHGLGAAVNRAINLALQLQRRNAETLEVSLKTDTVLLIDDFESADLAAHAGIESAARLNSAVHISVSRKQAVAGRHPPVTAVPLSGFSR